MNNGNFFVVLLISVALLSTACKKGPSEAELFEKAKQLQEKSDFQGAITAYQEFVKVYPKSPLAPQCQFMVGYLYANHLKNLDMGREAYKAFIKAYPEHTLVKDAQWELDHLGQDVNQIEELNKILTKEPGAGAAPDSAPKPK